MKPSRKIILYLVILAITISNITGCGGRDETAKYEKALLKAQRENTILDNMFQIDYSDKEYKRLHEIVKKIVSYDSQLYDYKFKMTIEQGYVPEVLLCNQLINDSNICRWIILYVSDIVSLFTKSTDQYNGFPYLKSMLGTSINELNLCIDDLDKITPNLNSIETYTVGLNLKDRIIEARDIIEKLRPVLEEKYKLADEKKGKTQQKKR